MHGWPSLRRFKRDDPQAAKRNNSPRGARFFLRGLGRRSGSLFIPLNENHATQNLIPNEHQEITLNKANYYREATAVNCMWAVPHYGC